MKTQLLVGRIFFGIIFIVSGFGHFDGGTIAYAAAQGVPLAKLLVPASGLLSIVGGLSVALGWRTRFGAWMLVLFLVPVTLSMHRFWGLSDAAAAMNQQAHFMKNLSMLGGALILAYFGAGPYSLDSRRLRRQVEAGSARPRAEASA